MLQCRLNNLPCKYLGIPMAIKKLTRANWQPLLDQEIDKWMKAFFWDGKEKANGGLCLVAWDKVCRPKCLGGLGVRDLRLHTIALRVRCEWLRRTNPRRPWQGIPMIEDKEAKLVFNSMIKISLGKGPILGGQMAARIQDWRDRT
ncbi:Phosphatidylinositol-4-phosphate 5-kinase 4 [Hordeum vulgare]|nr:Phosphatidylinositol-4-phosphate 5-kinase 4 [Hordeum vulgare]